MFMALKFNVPCVPHNGAMGLPELTSHSSMIDYVAISGRKSMLENADSHWENLRHPKWDILGIGCWSADHRCADWWRAIEVAVWEKVFRFMDGIATWMWTIVCQNAGRRWY
ncbi:hypothetical protein F5Y16DRAFT_367897 [Xylariaceae sp. FL0255]|nr:hypothetical protein F5Y16DRAFT_367897 [Xylariaceae sp. FL0255]